MPETIFKTFRAEVRGVNAEEGTVDLFIPVSTASMDRDGEVIKPEAFRKTLSKFMQRPVLVASHDYRDLTSQIGEWPKLKIGDNGLEGKPKYYINEGNEQADWGFKLASRGMAAFSIGFIPKVWEDGDGVKGPRRIFTEVELLEISQVIVPSNREAIQSIRAKGYGDEVANKLLDDILNDKELVTKPEETDEYIRIPVDTGNHEGHRIRTIDISEKEGIKALYCGTDKVVMTYLFAKAKGWDMAKARAWVKEHEGKTFDIAEEMVADLHEGLGIEAKAGHKYPREKGISQEEIADQLDYARELIEKGMNADTQKVAWELVKGIMRLSGGDIPVDIRAMIETKPIKETLGQMDILEAIKRISQSGGKQC